MRNVFLATLVLLTAACGAYRFPGGSASPSPVAMGTVAGTVLAVPCSPVEAAGQQCAGRPVPGVEIDFASGGPTARAVTDSTGHYAVTLAGGTWTVHVVGYMRVISGPKVVTVLAGSTVVADYVLDTGIRVPAPQQ
jgi:hypothetical protein